MTDSKKTFFRQSGWLVIANTFAGVFMVAAQAVASSLPAQEYGLFFALLRLFTILSIPAAGLQIVLAQKAAAAVTVERETELLLACRGIIRTLFVIWMGTALLFAIRQNETVASFRVSNGTANATALWVTLASVLPALCLPLFQGLLQGRQNFLWLGLSMILNGVGRCLFIGLAVLVFHGYAAGAMMGTMGGILLALAAAILPLLATFKQVRGDFPWRDWVRKLVPLTLGTGSVLFLLNIDIIVVHSRFPKTTAFYSAGSIVGLGLVTFTTPMASVMFPKLVRSLAHSQKSNSLMLALVGTAVLGCGCAIFCSLWPEFPLRIMYFRNLQYLKSAVLVPWFMWCLLPVTLANVLISNLLAKERFACIPWLVIVAAGYGIVLLNYTAKNVDGNPFEVFRHVIQILGCFSLLLFVVAAFFNWRETRREAAIA